MGKSRSCSAGDSAVSHGLSGLCSPREQARNANEMQQSLRRCIPQPPSDGSLVNYGRVARRRHIICCEKNRHSSMCSPPEQRKTRPASQNESIRPASGAGMPHLQVTAGARLFRCSWQERQLEVGLATLHSLAHGVAPEFAFALWQPKQMFTPGATSVLRFTLWVASPPVSPLPPIRQCASCWARRNTSGVLQEVTSPPILPAWQSRHWAFVLGP